jgi:4-coumarate--CoA ligase
MHPSLRPAGGWVSMHPSLSACIREVAVAGRLSILSFQHEAAPGVCSQRSASWDKPIGASGRLVPNMLAKLMGEDGKEVPSGSEGEICLKGPNIFKGYYNNAKATTEAFDAEGWYHTGDIGKADEQGNIYITNRLKDLIKYNGLQVAPVQLEDMLLGHAVVADVAVIGVYNNERATELPRAYVVAAAGYKGDGELGETLRKWMDRRVAPHKKLRGGVRFVDAIPKSDAGKVLRRVLLEQAKLEEEAKKKQAVVKARLQA